MPISKIKGYDKQNKIQQFPHKTFYFISFFQTRREKEKEIVTRLEIKKKLAFDSIFEVVPSVLYS